MLKEILAITGKPGLFRIVNHSGRTLIVEDIQTQKKFPVSMRDRVVSLADIAMYTEDGEKPLGEILDIIYEKEKGNKLDVKSLQNNSGLREQFEKYLPDFDKEKVHDSDVRKLFNWYNLLISNGLTKFSEEKEETEGKENKNDKEEG